MNAKCQAQFDQLRAELNGRLIPLFEDEELAVVCFAPDPVPAERPKVVGDWERADSPVLLVLGSDRLRTIMGAKANDIALMVSRGEPVKAWLTPSATH